jgi:hypothetical protein
VKLRQSVAAAFALSVLLSITSPAIAGTRDREEPRGVREFVSKIIRVVKHLVPSTAEDTVTIPRP